MRARRIATIALSGALLTGGAGAAIAAVTKDDGAKAEQAVLDSAAKQLDVTPGKLRDALATAQDEQLDAAVKAGRLTQKQADEMKAARKRSGHVLGGRAGIRPRGGHKPGFAGPRGRHGALRGGPFDGLAKALGIDEDKLREQLRAGTSLAAIAKANGKSLADVKTSVKAGMKTKLDKAVKDEDLTKQQADRILQAFDRRFDAFASGKRMRMRGGHHGPKPPAGKPKPGSFSPGTPGAQSTPDLPAPSDGVII